MQISEIKQCKRWVFFALSETLSDETTHYPKSCPKAVSEP